jgi:hypothetical protein
MGELGSGRIRPHVRIRDRGRTYRAHRDVMARSVREHLPQATFRLPDGGLVPLAVGADGVGSRNYLRLAYGYASPFGDVAGMRRLAVVFFRLAAVVPARH